MIVICLAPILVLVGPFATGAQSEALPKMIVLSRLADSMLDRERFDLLVTDASARSFRRANGSTFVIYHYRHERHRALVPHVEAVLREKDKGQRLA